MEFWVIKNNENKYYIGCNAITAVWTKLINKSVPMYDSKAAAEFIIEVRKLKDAKAQKIVITEVEDNA